jgi:hypothetical protein
MVMLVMAALVIVLGVTVWGLKFRLGSLPGLIVTLALGTAAFTTLGIGMTRFISNAERDRS